MKMSNSEMMKYLRRLSAEIRDILKEEEASCTTVYGPKEEKPVSDYDYAETSRRLEELYAEERRIREILNHNNATVIVPEFNMTISECLVYLAQLGKMDERLYNLYTKPEKTRVATFGGNVEITEVNYDRARAKRDYQKNCAIAASLQLAIDRINLNYVSEVGDLVL